MDCLVRHSPVRKIGLNSRSVTGVVPGFGAYESSLERDLMELLRFDTNVQEFIPQPLTIEYEDKEQRISSYTPDGLIYFNNKPFVSAPILFEVKYRSDFKREWRVLMPKFRAAKAFCLSKGWRFEVFTEREIRTPYLGNVKFLWDYRERKPDSGMSSHILQILADLDLTDPEMLLCALCSDPSNRAQMIPNIWHLISVGDIGCDLDRPLTMHSRIWPVKEGFL